MANRCGCGSRISRGATHCKSCARSGGGYRSNMAAELADQKRKDDLAAAAAARAAAKVTAKAKARQQEIAARAKAAKARDQKKSAAKRDRVKDIKTVRQLSNVRGKPDPKPEKKKWWQ